MDYLELKYLGMVAYKLRNYKQRSNTLINCSCCYCGDSNHKKSKARMYIIEKNGKSVAYCHNCSVTTSVPNLIKFLDENVYREYLMEKFKETRVEKPEYKAVDFTTGLPKRFNNKILASLKRVSQYSPTSGIKEYINKRMIPSNLHYRLYFCPKFMEFTNSVIPHKFSEAALKFDEPRLLIPFWDELGNIHAFQGRSFKKNSDPKYITIVIDETLPKLYGLDTFSEKAHGYVTEGPIDSLFISNCLATAGGDIASALKSFDKKKLTIVYDNERRSIHTVHKMEKAVKEGYNLCIWPDNFNPKDINDAVVAGYTQKQIKTIIDDNTFSGMSAELRLGNWKKCKVS